MVVAALLAVVVGQALLANGQVKLSALHHELTMEQSSHSEAELAVAQLETPARIVAAATRGGLVAQSNVIELPYVSLSVPLPTPKVTPAPAPTPPTTSSAGAGAPSGTGTASTSSLFVHRDNDADVDAVSVTTRQGPDRARAGSGRQSTAKTTSTRTPRPLAGPRPARPAQPGRRQPAVPRRPAVAAGSHERDATTAAPPPPAGQGRPAPALAPAARLGERDLLPPGAARPHGAPRRHAAPRRPPGRRPGPALRLVPGRGAGESSISVSLAALRGGIYDRDGSPLAVSVATDDVVADDFQIAHPVQTALALSPIIHVPATTLAAELHRRTGYVVVARQLSQATGQTISKDAFPGISLIADSKRVVPNGNLATPVVGFTNAAGQGAAGLEFGDNHLLAGTNGKATIMESPGGVTLPQSPVTQQVASSPGTGLELTLDSQLQYESEQALAKAIKTSNSVSGTAVVMDVKTGQILSMASLTATTRPPSARPRRRPPPTPGASCRSGRRTPSTRRRATLP